jgi:hypothetical protein
MKTVVEQKLIIEEMEQKWGGSVTHASTMCKYAVFVTSVLLLVNLGLIWNQYNVKKKSKKVRRYSSDGPFSTNDTHNKIIFE